MTRFARAKGSKASNERLPEEATSWSEMKQQLVEKQQQIEESKKRNVAEQKRQANYKSFLEEIEEKECKESKWVEFPEEKSVVDVNDDEGPEECSSKVALPELKITKKKTSSKALKIVVHEDTPEEIEEEAHTVAPVKSNKRKSAKNEEDKQSAKKMKNEQKMPQKIKKDPSELTEQELKKIEKKKQKKLKQIAKKKLKSVQPSSAILESNDEAISGSIQDKPPLEKIEKINKKPMKTQEGKMKTGKKPERRKQMQNKMIINGEEVEIAYIEGFPVKKEDADRIRQLRKQMISKGLPRSEINISLKMERRKAEKALARQKKNVCFNCRRSGHVLSDCPKIGEQELTESTATGICFKCGSTEHTHFDCKVVKGHVFKFACCFICKEQGHIARQCPDNAKGLYPKGGGCRQCGDVTHLQRDCPKYKRNDRKPVVNESKFHDMEDDSIFSQNGNLNPPHNTYMLKNKFCEDLETTLKNISQMQTKILVDLETLRELLK